MTDIIEKTFSSVEGITGESVKRLSRSIKIM